MDTRDDPNAINDSAIQVLRYGSEASRRCRGVTAAAHPEVVYFLGCYRTWMGAVVALHAPNASAALAALIQASDHTATSLMATLRVYASQRPVEQAPLPASKLNPHDAMNIEMEILSEEDWLTGADTSGDWTSEPIVDATEGLTPTQVYGHLRDFSDGVPGYWLLGRLEASTGLQAALAVALVSGCDAGQRVVQLRTAIALQCEAARSALQPLVDTINSAHRLLHATCETLFVEGLQTKAPRLIVVSGTHTPHEQSHPG